MHYVKSLRKTCNACPAQWEGETDTHEKVYIRYRGGWLRVDINKRTIYCEFVGEDTNDEEYEARWRNSGFDKDVIEKMISSHKVMREFNDGAPVCYDGSMTLERLRETTRDFLVLPQHEDLSAE